MEISKEQRAHRQNHYTRNIRECLSKFKTVESKVAHTTGLAKPATRADHSNDLLTNQYTYI
jgi:hypothetical protein